MIWKIIALLFLLIWSVLGVYLVLKYNVLFGPHPDDPSETPGSRSYGVTHIIAVWVGGFGLGIYCLFL